MESFENNRRLEVSVMTTMPTKNPVLKPERETNPGGHRLTVCLSSYGRMLQTMRNMIKTCLGTLNRPIVRIAPYLPFSVHAYLAGIGHGRDRTHPIAYILAKVAVVNNIRPVRDALSVRLARMPIEEQRRLAPRVWQASSVMAWAQRAYENTEQRAQSYPYQQARALAQTLGRPLRILELGTMNGGSLQCLQHLGVPIARFVGVDISSKMIAMAQARFPDTAASFVVEDFLDFCTHTQERFDVLILKQTALFLDQSYLEQVFTVLASRRLTDRIAFHEYCLRNQGPDSTMMKIGNASINYSHNYELLCRRHSFHLVTGGWHYLDRKPTLQFFDALVEHTDY